MGVDVNKLIEDAIVKHALETLEKKIREKLSNVDFTNLTGHIEIDYSLRIDKNAIDLILKTLDLLMKDLGLK